MERPFAWEKSRAALSFLAVDQNTLQEKGLIEKLIFIINGFICFFSFFCRSGFGEGAEGGSAPTQLGKSLLHSNLASASSKSFFIYFFYLID